MYEPPSSLLSQEKDCMPLALLRASAYPGASSKMSYLTRRAKTTW